MNTIELISYWQRMKAKAPDGHTLFMSPNKCLWAIVDEQRNQTVEMWDVNTGHVYRQQPPAPWGSDKLPPEDRDPTIPDRSLHRTLLAEPKTTICVNCPHEIRWSKVAIPPRWEHVRTQSNDEHSRLFWICECGCMTPEPKEAQS
jgi:hypothetical protein